MTRMNIDGVTLYSISFTIRKDTRYSNKDSESTDLTIDANSIIVLMKGMIMESKGIF